MNKKEREELRRHVENLLRIAEYDINTMNEDCKKNDMPYKFFLNRRRSRAYIYILYKDGKKIRIGGFRYCNLDDIQNKMMSILGTFMFKVYNEIEAKKSGIGYFQQLINMLQKMEESKEEAQDGNPHTVQV
jgi:uncharacterized protein YxeA